MERVQSTIDSEGFKGAPEVPPLCRETQSLGQQMLNTPVGINELTSHTTGKVVALSGAIFRPEKSSANTKLFLFSVMTIGKNKRNIDYVMSANDVTSIKSILMSVNAELACSRFIEVRNLRFIFYFRCSLKAIY